MRTVRSNPTRWRLVASLAVMFALGAPAATGPAAAQTPLATGPIVSSGFDAYVAKSLREWNVPGLSIAIVKDGRTYVRGYGVRKLGEPAPVDANTVFEIASTSKAFTATAIGLLVDGKKAGWDDPVTKALPSFQMQDPWITHEITLRDMLTHRSGLTGGYELLGDNSRLSRDEIVRRVRYLQLSPPFRSAFGYSNLGYLVAGQTIPAVTGESWGTFLRERIFRPLEMTSTTTAYQDLMASPNHSAAHEALEGELQIVQTVDNDKVGPAGSVNSTATDMSHWVQMLLDGGTFHGQRVIASATLAETMSPQMVVPPRVSHDDLYGDAVVRADSAGLRLSSLGTERRLAHWDYDTFRVVPESPGLFDQPYVTFALDETGAVHSMKIDEGPNAVLTRAP